ncbi:uncharacterized protein LOC136069244 [Quercus suber]|uniref:uncharacterized protein LOC136069244 n=1 Tax=Quercus suber TaxID=58331 RepID=UPI0032DEB280
MAAPISDGIAQKIFKEMEEQSDTLKKKGSHLTALEEVKLKKLNPRVELVAVEGILGTSSVDANMAKASTSQPKSKGKGKKKKKKDFTKQDGKQIALGVADKGKKIKGKGFQETRKLNEGELFLTLANGSRIPIVVVGVVNLCFEFRVLILEDFCESCLEGKMTKRPFNAKRRRAQELHELVHTNVCGPMSTQAKGGYEYFITFTDDYSRYGYVYIMRRKFEAFEKFKEFRAEVKNQLGKRIKVIRFVVVANTFLGFSMIT